MRGDACRRGEPARGVLEGCTRRLLPAWHRHLHWHLPRYGRHGHLWLLEIVGKKSPGLVQNKAPIAWVLAHFPARRVASTNRHLSYSALFNSIQARRTLFCDLDRVQTCFDRAATVLLLQC